MRVVAIWTSLALSLLLVDEARPQEKPPSEAVQEIANASGCAGVGQAQASRDYIRGMALVFARAVCHPERAETQVASAMPSEPVSLKNHLDGVSVFDAEFRSLKIPNDSSPATMLRHTYVLLTGLGFRESSGWYCVGRYTAQGFSKSTEAEAGLFQTSWGAHRAGSSLEPLFRAYQKDPSQCLLDVFRDHPKCTSTDAIDWNSEHNKDLTGVDWQHLTKQCPAFAVEYASVVIRNLGGAQGEFGPVKCYAGTQPAKIQASCKKVQIYPVCDAMFLNVQTWLKANPSACSSL
jgi:hypothetical protein